RHGGGMTTSTPAGPTPVSLGEPGHLLAALPYLVGFRPENSVVLLGHRAPEGTRVGLVLRADLPRREDRARLAQALAPRFVLPPPRTTVLAAAVAESGTVVFDSRDELATLLAPRSPEALARRAEALARLPSPPWPDATCIADAASVIRAAFDRQRRGEGPPT